MKIKQQRNANNWAKTDTKDLTPKFTEIKQKDKMNYKLISVLKRKNKLLKSATLG